MDKRFELLKKYRASLLLSSVASLVGWFMTGTAIYMMLMREWKWCSLYLSLALGLLYCRIAADAMADVSLRKWINWYKNNIDDE
jgi:hypothetical protein